MAKTTATLGYKQDKGRFLKCLSAFNNATRHVPQCQGTATFGKKATKFGHSSPQLLTLTRASLNRHNATGILCMHNMASPVTLPSRHSWAAAFSQAAWNSPTLPMAVPCVTGHVADTLGLVKLPFGRVSGNYKNMVYTI
jgi:hypothetical protein